MDFLYIEPKKDIFLDEENNLKHNIKEIENNINNKKEVKEKLENECLNLKGDYENIEYFVETNSKLKETINEIVFLEKNINSPYFGHMLLTSNNELFDIFIGDNSIDNLNLKKIVYDWRSPICSLYYANQTNYQYNGYFYELSFKRNLIIENKELKECVETYSNEEENTEVNDYFLRKLIKQKREESGFTDIIKSIQQKQNEIIRSGLNTNFICQGVAGSGKTAIIVHRISYLLFNNPNTSAEEFLYIAPNDNFKKELNELNKKLQIDNIVLNTLYEYYINKINSYLNDNEKIKKIIDDNEKDITIMYSFEYIEKNLEIVKKLFLDLIIKYQTEYKLELNNEIDLIKKSKDVYTRVYEILEDKVKEKNELKHNIINLKDELKQDIKIIFKNNQENVDFDKGYLEHINNKFNELKLEYNKTDYNKIKNKITEYNEKISYNQMIINERTQEKNKLNTTISSVLFRLFNNNSYNEKLKRIKEIDQIINNLTLENKNIQQELVILEKNYSEKENINKLDMLEKFAKIFSKFIIELNEKKEDLKLTNHEVLEFKFKYQSIMKKIYNITYTENIEELTILEEKLNNIIDKLNSINLNALETKEIILNNMKRDFSPYNIILIYLNNICNKKYDLNEGISNIKLYRNDAFQILYILHKMNINNKSNYHYLYIDEAQDYNDLEIKLLRDIENSNICVFGDYKQNISSNAIIRSDWNDLKNILGSNTNYYDLNENYRNTINVVDYCNKNLKLKMQPVGISGNAVEILENKSIEDLISNAKKTDSVIITNNEKIISEIHKDSSIRVFRVKEAKGLEFKNAIVIDDDLDNNSKYIAYTRTLNDLQIYRSLRKKFNEYQEKILKSISDNLLELENSDTKTRNDKEFMLQAIEKNNLSIRYLGEELKNNEEFMGQELKKYDWFIGYASEELKNNEDFMLQVIKQNSWNARYISEELRNNKHFMLQAINQSAWCILCASNKLLNDEEFMLKAIEQESWLINLIPQSLKNNKEFMLQAIEKNSLCIEYVGDTLLEDKNFKERILEIIDISSYLMENPITDKELIFKAIEKNNIYCFAYVDNELRNDRNFMLQAIEKNSSCIGYSSNNLLADMEFMLKVIQKNPKCINFASIDLKCNKEFMLKAIEKDIWCMEYARDNLKNDKEFMIEAINKQNFRCLVYENANLRNDKEFMLRAIEIDNRCYELINTDLRYDEDIVLKLKQTNK